MYVHYLKVTVNSKLRVFESSFTWQVLTKFSDFGAAVDCIN